ncbi:hypothetical protein FRB94_008770 [Tulasnella sp. JGI-2019a]|nr:hypothetical protein FRB93_008301 [Tulasnella sp. JGI-2019a]KAG8995807.1 hypothetical protein FRB94_008770 [Tulasnella sp. JGI-2019a]
MMRLTTIIALLALLAPQSAQAVLVRGHRRLSTGAKIGIMVALIVLAVLAILVTIILRRNRTRSANRAYAIAAQGSGRNGLKVHHPPPTGTGGYRPTADPEAQNYATQPVSQVKFPEPSHQTTTFQPPSAPPPPASEYNPVLDNPTGRKPTLPPYNEGNDNSRYN